MNSPHIFRNLGILLLICLDSRCWGQADRSDPLCGAKCLYTGLLALDLPAGDYKEFLSNCGPLDEKGLSMGRLSEIAIQYGAHTLPVQTTLQNLSLRDQRFVCIAHVNQDHFVLIGAINKSTVWIVDPPRQSTIIDNIFTDNWDGKALLIARESLAPEESVRQSNSRWLPIIVIVTCLLSTGFFFMRRAK